MLTGCICVPESNTSCSSSGRKETLSIHVSPALEAGVLPLRAGWEGNPVLAVQQTVGKKGKGER